MCASDLPVQPKPSALSEPPRRRHLGLADIATGWHCTIVGTCLTIAELRTIADKSGYQLAKSTPTDYEIHTGMIRLIGEQRQVARTASKMLDRKFATALTRFKRAATPEELETLWREAAARGEVAGACWALMSHGDASEDLRARVFGEIHMLSHQVGAAQRADNRRLHQLEQEKAALETKITRQQTRLAEEIGKRETELHDLRRRIDQEIAENRRLSHASCAAIELDGLRALVSELQRHLSQEGDARKRAEADAHDARRDAARKDEELAQARQETAAIRAELTSLETRLGDLLAPPDSAAPCDGDCGRPDLCGRCILYVGGRSTQVQHLRRLVEQCNGTLVHHDGGLEDGIGRLTGLFGQADAVLFPVDCVSHGAHDHVKRLCKRWEKPFVPVVRSGLGAFMRALETLEGDPANPAG